MKTIPSKLASPPNPNRAWHRDTGFTLIELLVTITIAVILLTTAIPSFQDFFRNSRIATVSNEILASISLARSEAIRRGEHISVCRSSTGTSCADAGNGWDAGWIVFVNLDNDSPAVVDAGETVLRVSPAVPPNFTVRPNINFKNFVTFNQSGRSNNVGRFVLCNANSLSNSRALFIIRSGRVRVASDSNGNGIPEDEDGVDITTCTP